MTAKKQADTKPAVLFVDDDQGFTPTIALLRIRTLMATPARASFRATSIEDASGK